MMDGWHALRVSRDEGGSSKVKGQSSMLPCTGTRVCGLFGNKINGCETTNALYNPHHIDNMKGVFWRF